MGNIGTLDGFTPADRTKFTEAMRRAATTVAVVTTTGPAGQFGVTVSAVSSVSADPPSILVCVNHGSPVAEAITRNGVFAVNLLDVHQQDISEIFAGRHPTSREEHLQSRAWTTLATGVPVLTGAAAVFDCRVAAQITFGTHLLLVGGVEELNFAPDAPPLVYHDRNYSSVVTL